MQPDGRRIQLTVHRLSESDDPSTALVTDWDSPAALGEGEFAYRRDSDSDSTLRAPAFAEDDQLVVQMADTADAALNALEWLILKQRATVANA